MSGAPGPVSCGQRGSGTALVAGALLVAMVVAAAVLVVAGYLTAAHRARAAADLVALSGAAAQAHGEDPCRAAARAAAANRVRLSACRVRGDSLDHVVSVAVALGVPNPAPVLPGEVQATAHAGRLGLLR